MEASVEERSGDERGEGADRRMLERMILPEGEVGVGVDEGKGCGSYSNINMSPFCSLFFFLSVVFVLPS